MQMVIGHDTKNIDKEGHDNENKDKDIHDNIKIEKVGHDKENQDEDGHDSVFPYGLFYYLSLQGLGNHLGPRCGEINLLMKIMPPYCEPQRRCRISNTVYCAVSVFAVEIMLGT